MVDETYEVGTLQGPRTIRIGQRLCVKGQGTALGFHTHDYKVKRVTKTAVVLEDSDGSERRFRRESLRSIPYQPYGGWRAHVACQGKST